MVRSLGNVLLVVTALLVSGSSGCRKDSPPSIDVCISDGFGGNTCILRKGSELLAKCSYFEDGGAAGWYCSPTASERLWCTTQADMEAFSSWAYSTSKKNVRANLKAYSHALGYAHY